MRSDDLDFEISFFEKLLDKNPHFVQALEALGEAYTRKGMYREGLAVDKKLARIKPGDAEVFYNLACDYSLLKKISLSLKVLEKAIILGYSDFRYMDEDRDLEYVRSDSRYRDLVRKYSGGCIKKRGRNEKNV